MSTKKSKRKRRWKRDPLHDLLGTKPRQMNSGPTREAMEKRRLLAGGGDQTIAGYPLGVLLAREVISRPQHDAGIRYGFLFAIRFGNAQLGGSVLARAQAVDGPLGVERTEAQQRAFELLHGKARGVLQSCGPTVVAVVEAVSVHEDMGFALDRVHHGAIQDGLEALHRLLHEGMAA